MNLESFFEPEFVPLQSVEERIKQRRSQMLVHSYLYYGMDESIVSDGQWQEWADELVQLHKVRKKINFYDRAFKDWDGATGSHLPADEWVKNKAIYLLTLSSKKV